MWNARTSKIKTSQGEAIKKIGKNRFYKEEKHS
jgi:hypothetical protein